jgi:hypothetical protein
MTIVLQHQYRDLAVGEEAFSVTLRFGGAPERLHVPFAALVAFADPAAEFGLRFEAAEARAPSPLAPPADMREEALAAERSGATDEAGGNVVDIRTFRRRDD